MCNYCHLKRIKKWARSNNQKVVIENYGARILPRNWKPGDKIEDKNIYWVFSRAPDRCRC